MLIFPLSCVKLLIVIPMIGEAIVKLLEDVSGKREEELYNIKVMLTSSPPSNKLVGIETLTALLTRSLVTHLKFRFGLRLASSVEDTCYERTAGRSNDGMISTHIPYWPQEEVHCYKMLHFSPPAWEVVPEENFQYSESHSKSCIIIAILTLKWQP